MDRYKHFNIALYETQDFQCFADGKIDVVKIKRRTEMYTKIFNN